ncbi:ribonuclease H-like domain-containing protein [Hypoxylon crocopeplum]|nr:ribonuclease H-like domain-containing protein [Hypoxylon crocopeplum]
MDNRPRAVVSSWACTFVDESQRLEIHSDASHSHGLVNGGQWCNGPGRGCDCKACLRKEMNCEMQDISHLKNQMAADDATFAFRLLSARLAMLKDGVYIPNKFDPVPHSDTAAVVPDPPKKIFLPHTYSDGAYTWHRLELGCRRTTGPRSRVRMQLIYTDGACTNNGYQNARGGVGFSFSNHDSGHISLPLPLEVGRDSAWHQPTSNVAELQAVIEALRWLPWYREGWDALVIATDSAYVASGATKWISSWINNRWRSAKGTQVSNIAQWKILLKLFRRYAMHGCEIMFWKIPRELNSVADELAKRGATLPVHEYLPAPLQQGTENGLRLHSCPGIPDYLPSS